MDSFPSIHNLPPRESGGVVARNGFGFQDHVAASFCIAMLNDARISQVWCETQDDITLIRQENDREEVEYIQVKDISLGKLWSVSDLCRREKGVEGTSLLEKSFGYDCAKESSWFRIVTSLPTATELEVLQLPFTSPLRKMDNSPKITMLHGKIADKLSNIQSPKGNSLTFWVERTQWQVTTEEFIYDENIISLKKYLESIEVNVSLAKVEMEIYPKLLDKVRDAGNQKWEVNPLSKKICRDSFISWLKNAANESVSDNKLKEKMLDKAKIPEDYLITAIDERILYRQNTLDTGYLDLSNWKHCEGEILSDLGHLRLKLDIGNISEGLPFYKRCQDKMLELWKKNGRKVPLYMFNGCMHEITDRCGHRYHRAGKE